jgi:hypothetical protein
MYEETMKAIRTTLVRKGLVKGLSYTIELLPDHRPKQKVYDYPPFFPTSEIRLTHSYLNR